MWFINITHSDQQFLDRETNRWDTEWIQTRIPPFRRALLLYFGSGQHWAHVSILTYLVYQSVFDGEWRRKKIAVRSRVANSVYFFKFTCVMSSKLCYVRRFEFRLKLAEEQSEKKLATCFAKECCGYYNAPVKAFPTFSNVTNKEF